MAGNEIREPKLGEIIEEIKRLREESAKGMENSSMGIWLTPLSVGIAIGLFGLAGLVGVAIKDWHLWWPDAGILCLGLWLVFWSRHKVKEMEKRFIGKWKEAPRF